MKVKEKVNEQRERPDYAHTQQEAPRRSRSAASEDHDSSSRQGAPSWRHDETGVALMMGQATAVVLSHFAVAFGVSVLHVYRWMD